MTDGCQFLADRSVPGSGENHSVLANFFGEVAQSGPPQQVLVNPQHPRTRDFIAAVLS